MRLHALFILLLLWTTNAWAQDFLPEYARGTPDDEYLPPPPRVVTGDPPYENAAAEIEAVMQRYHEAFSTEDVEGLIETFAPDAHWTNAFGLVIRGHEEMRRFFPALFEFMDASETKQGETIHVRFLGKDVAVIQRYTQSGGGVANRETEGPRQIQVTSVLQNFEEGWKTVHQMIMDVRLP